MDINYCRQLFQDILSSPHDISRRVTPTRDIRSSWVMRLLRMVGFLPDDRASLVLTNDGEKLFGVLARVHVHVFSLSYSN